MKRIHIDNHVKEDMQRRDPDWWRPEDEKYWSLQKESVKQREEIERRIDKRVNLIVDVGGGQGRMLSLAHRADAMVLLDISEKMIKRSKYNAERQGIDNSCFIVGDAENIPLKKSSVDVVICLQTLIHVLDREKCIGELSRIMRGDGALIVDIPIHNPINFIYWSLRHGGIKNLLVDVMRMIGVSKSYSAPMKRREFYDRCKRLNLSIVDRFTVGPWNTFILKKKVTNKWMDKKV